MPFKAKAACRRHIPKQQHKVTNWAAYDAALRQRGGLVTLTEAGRYPAGPRSHSCCGGRATPLVPRLGSEDPERAAGDEVALNVAVLHGSGVRAQ